MLQRIICHPPSFFAPPSKLQRPQNTIQCMKKFNLHRLLKGLDSFHPLSNQVGEGLISGRDPLTFFLLISIPKHPFLFLPPPHGPLG